MGLSKNEYASMVLSNPEHFNPKSVDIRPDRLVDANTQAYNDEQKSAASIQTDINKNIIHRKGIDVYDNIVNVFSKSAALQRDVTNPVNNYFASMWTLDYKQLENIYMTTWIGKKIIDLPNKFIFKNGFELEIDDGKNTSLEKEAMDFYQQRKLENRLKQANAIKRIYGGCIILPKDKTQDPGKPYDISQFKGKDTIDKLEFIVRDLSYLAVTPHIDIVSERYFEPERINLAGVTSLAENCILFKGIQVPLRRMPQFRYLGMSIYQNIFQALIADEYVSKGIVNMVYRGNMKYYKLKGLHDLVKQKEEELAIARITNIENYASILSAGILDSEDEVEFVQQSFASLADIDERSLTRLAAASNIPSMVLLGRAPEKTGLGSGTDGELENWYNYVEEEQKDVEPEMEHLFKYICAILDGKEHKIRVKFKKPQNINPKMQAETDTIILSNMQAQQSLGFPDDIIKDYGVRTGLITTEQASKIGELTNEMMEMAEMAQEESDNASKIPAKTNSPKK